MRLFWFVLCIGLLVQPGMAAQDISLRIINGTKVDVSDAGFYVALMAPFSWTGGTPGSHWNPFCGGSYLGDGIVITAAHCMEIIPSGATFGVVLGNQNATGDMQYEYCNSVKPQGCKVGDDIDLANTSSYDGYHYTHYLAYVGSDVIEVKRSNSTVLEHPAYRPYGNDLALIKLPSVPGNLSLSLPSIDNWQSTLGREYRVVGHGDTLSDLNDSTFEPSAELLFADVDSRSDTLCSSIYGSNFEPDNMLCAGNPSSNPNAFGKDSCQGDSGGPLFDGTTLVGVVSWGGQCARYYGVYSDVFALRHWLNTARSNLNGEYSFPQSIDFGTQYNSLSDTLSWRFINTSGSSVLLSNFDFSQLSNGYSVLGNGCSARTVLHGQSCLLTLSARHRDSGVYNSTFTFKAGATTMEVSTLAQVLRRKKGGSLSPWLLLLMPLVGIRLHPRKAQS